MNESPDRILRFLDRAHSAVSILAYTFMILSLGVLLGVALSMIYGVEKWQP